MPSVVVDTSASGDTPLVANPGPNRFVRVLGYVLTANAATVVRLRDTGGGELSGPLYCLNSPQGGISAPFNLAGWFDTPPNTGLKLNSTNAIALGGHVQYTIEGASLT